MAEYGNANGTTSRPAPPHRPGLADTLASRVVVSDGGLATELERRGNDLSGGLWSARLLHDRPNEILAAHRAFFAAGAQVATTASYQASVDGLAARGLDPVRTLRRSVRLAAQARDEHGHGWVAGSIGPYGAVLADGSEYRGDYGRSVAELRRFHRPRLEILADAGPDVLAVETIPCLAEVEALLAELERIDLPAWLSLTCAGDRTRAGEPARAGFAMAANVPTVFAVGVNCIDPADVAALVRQAGAASGKPVVAYPNSGEIWAAAAGSWVGPSRLDPAAVADWIGAGARLVGGCCRVGPADISRLATQVRGEPARVS